MKKYLIFSMTVLLCASCATIKDDIFINSALTEKVQPQISEIELALVRQLPRFYRGETVNQDEMKKIYNELNELLGTPSSDEKYLAQIHGLMADYYLLQRSPRKAQNFIESALKKNPLDEYALIAKTKSMKRSEALEYASAIVERFPNYLRLAAYLGHVQFEAGDYQAAVVHFDSSLPFLDKAYTDVYAEERAISYKKYSIGNDMSKIVDEFIGKEKILLLDMTTLTDEMTDAFNTITGNAKWKSTMLADRLKAAGWYRADAQLTTEYALRKDVAIFLWHLLCSDNESRLSMYSNKYKSRTRSPIADVPIGAEYFDASLAMVENDIITLIAGRYFSPEQPVSGADFYRYLQKVNSRR